MKKNKGFAGSEVRGERGRSGKELEQVPGWGSMAYEGLNGMVDGQG